MNGSDNVPLDQENSVVLNSQMMTNAKPARAFGREIHNKNRSNFSAKSKRLRQKESAAPETRDRTTTSLRLSKPTIKTLEEYHASINAHLLEKDLRNPVRKDYMQAQTDINAKMRSILVDWLVDVHLKFELLPQTLFGCVSLIDRYLQVTELKRTRLQLVGVASLMIVAKIEEVYSPMVKDYLAVCDNAYSAAELLAMEGEILATLGFNVLCPSAYTFLSNYNFRMELEDKLFYYCQYLLETALLEMNHLKHSSAVLAAGAIFFANKLFKKEGWPQDYEAVTGVGEAALKAAAKDIFLSLQKSEKGELRAVAKKFAESQFLEVSKYQIQRGGAARD